MTAEAPDTPGDGAFIRGGAVTPLDARRLRRTLVAIGLALLAAVTLLYTTDAAQSSLATNHLTTRGQTVEVTVTSCLGLASGTGITPAGYTCRGTFLLHGHRYNDVINGSSTLHPVGQTLTAITDPRDPGTLFTTSAVAAAPARWRNFILPGSLFALLLLCSAIAYFVSRHHV